jgi:DNA invertase Pin-like site-specific DNA recombinase
MNEKILRVASYSRVSTSFDQNIEVQVERLRNYSLARGWRIIHEIKDQGYSGATDNRPGLKQLLALERKREIDVIVCVKLDRLFRSLKHLVNTLQELTELKVQFISTEDNIDLTTSAGKMMVHMLGAFAEFERSLISERTRIGLDHAKQVGKIIGRPQTVSFEKIRELRFQGLSYREISKNLNCSLGAVSRALEDVNRKGFQK